MPARSGEDCSSACFRAAQTIAPAPNGVFAENHLAFGLAVLTLVVMFVYETILAPDLVIAWIVLFLPMVLILIGVALLYARMRLRTTMRILQESVLKM
jgi:hypothetical protein